jgi:plasmid stabilization system protein ParE
LRRLSRRAAGDARGRFAHRAREAEEQASQLRDTLLRIGRSAVEATAAGEPETEP